MLAEIIRHSLKESPGVVSVVASAGSGKTFTLTSLYIALLLKGIPIDSILAITFTNKAVDEMRLRVISRLMAMYFEGKEVDFFSSVLGESEEKIRFLAGTILEKMLFNLSMMSIQTIDSFLNRLRMAFSLELGISPYAQIRNSIYPDMEMILGALLLEAQENEGIRSNLMRFIHRFAAGLSVYRSWDPIDYARDVFLSFLYQESYSGLQIGRMDCRPLKALREEVIQKRDRFLDFVRRSSLSLKTTVYKALEGISIDALQSLTGISSSYFRKLDIEDYLDIYKKESRTAKLKEVSDGYGLWRKFLESLYEFCESVSVSIPMPFVEVYAAFKSILESYQRENDVTYLNLLQIHISRLDPMVVAEKSCMRVSRYKYFLIDEFQDTSLSQWTALRPLLEELLSQGGLLFCVGDPKQTIYRWRGSRPDMFQLLKGAFNAEFREFVLDTNWRSSRQLVEFNNRIFSVGQEIGARFDNGHLDGIYLGYLSDCFSPDKVCQQSVIDISGGVELVYWDDLQDIQDYVDAIFSIVQNKLGCSDVCILVRTNSQARDLLLGLSQKGVPVISDESVALTSNPIIRSIICLLKWIRFPENNTYLYMFLMSDLWKRVSGRANGFWEKEIRIRESDSLASMVMSYVSIRPSSSLYLYVKTLMDRLDVFTIYPEHRLYLNGFLDMIWRWEMENNSLLSEFLDYWDKQDTSYADAERLAMPMLKDTVKIMTIHSSKGLEFDTVILPFLAIDFIKRKSGRFDAQLHWVEGDALYPHYVNKKMLFPMTKLERLYNQENTLILWDNMNLLYVAMTRAKRRLILLLPGQLNPGNRIKLWAEFVTRDARSELES